MCSLFFLYLIIFCIYSHIVFKCHVLVYVSDVFTFLSEYNNGMIFFFFLPHINIILQFSNIFRPSIVVFSTVVFHWSVWRHHFAIFVAPFYILWLLGLHVLGWLI